MTARRVCDLSLSEPRVGAPRRLEVYRSFVADVVCRGIVTPHDMVGLCDFQRLHHIDERQHVVVLQEVRTDVAERGSTACVADALSTLCSSQLGLDPRCLRYQPQKASRPSLAQDLVEPALSPRGASGRLSLPSAPSSNSQADLAVSGRDVSVADAPHLRARAVQRAH